MIRTPAYTLEWMKAYIQTFDYQLKAPKLEYCSISITQNQTGALLPKMNDVLPEYKKSQLTVSWLS